ncbi:hypothetical protein EG328_006615 [Venturia inaequalis]|uniref:Large ribosomal subunit protein mL40 n=1 Tax=Venturia inaequalis TaxID=5025 RepID=A0A8H3YQV9_VENIN|nr:hypothetical protein EG328_006615 [Venturia inaequalis]
MKFFWSIPSIRAGASASCSSIVPRTAPFQTCQWQSTLPKRIQCSAFSTSPILQKRKKGDKKDIRITLIRYFLLHPKTPRVLRLSRLRGLRHWTIHRAWQLHKAKLRKQQELDLERQYNEMRKACEELRLIGSNGLPGGKDEGKLFRTAMMKQNVWQGVPIEYARIQTQWPSKDGWNHGWTRG